MNYLISIFILTLLTAPQLFAQESKANLRSPNISANALMLYRNSNKAKTSTDTVRNGLDLQEAEIAFYSDVDPYTRLNIILSLHPEYTAGTSNVTQEWKIEPEEAFAESIQIPLTTLKLGKFKAEFGKHNRMHTHAYPLVDAPLANTKLLGDEGLNDIGLSASVLIPFPWFSELTAQYLRGEGENSEFNSATPNDAVGVGHFKNLFDLNESSTFELGLSYAAGNNSLSKKTTLKGADVTYKWRPMEGGKYHSFIFGGELISRDLEQGLNSTEKASGWNLWQQYQWGERWFSMLRFDQLQVKGSDSTLNSSALGDDSTKRYSGAIEFRASEFSSYKLEYDQQVAKVATSGDRTEHKFYLQASFTIGAHPSHSY